MKVNDLMTTDVKCCPDYSSLNTAAHMMWEYDVGCVPIVNQEERVVGMLTDRDICMSAYLQGVPLKDALVTSAMSKEVFSCRPDDDIATAEKLMREKQLHRLPVVDVEGKLVGLISQYDIAREAAREAETRRPRQVADAEITQLVASVRAPRHRVVEAKAA
jgi:CBS domain-containing protein